MPAGFLFHQLPYPILKEIDVKLQNPIRLFLFLAFFAFLVSACSPVASAFVKLDPALANWITIGATLLVGLLLVQLSNIPALKWLADYLGQYRLAVSAWLAGIIVQFLQAGLLDKIPAMWDNVVTIVMQLIVAVIVTLYGFRLLGDRGVKGFRG